MNKYKTDNDASSSPDRPESQDRRDLLVGAGVALGASLLPQSLLAQDVDSSGTTTVFTNTTVVTNDSERRTLRDVALAVRNDVIAAIGDTAEVLEQFPQASVYDGRRKALLPGLINCHAHLAATIAKGFNEDYGFPNSLNLVARGQAHSVMKNICLRDITTEFIESGTVQDLDTSCVENIRPAPFFTSLLGPDP